MKFGDELKRSSSSTLSGPGSEPQPDGKSFAQSLFLQQSSGEPILSKLTYAGIKHKI